MNTVTGLEKKLNRVSRQVKAALQLAVLLVAIVGILSGLYYSYPEEVLIENSSTPSPVPSPFPSPEILSANLEQVGVVRVVDGDTIRLEDGRTVRYIGIDTPETVAPNTPVECFGKEASEFNRQLVEQKTVWLEKDVSETDRYGRLLRYVYLEPSASLSAQVNYRLVEQGYAYSSSYPPDIKWQDALQKAAQTAQAQQAGLWSQCISKENDI